MSTRRRPNRTSDSSNETVGIETKSTDQEFEIILKAFWFTGMTFAPFTTLFSIRGFLILCFDILVNVTCVYFMASHAFVAATKSPHSAGHSFILAVANLIGLFIRLTLLVKRGRIRKCSEMIHKLNQDMMMSDSKSLRRFSLVGSSLSLIFPLVLMSFSFLSNDFHAGSKRLQDLYFFGYKIAGASAMPMSILMVLFRIVNVLLTASLPLMTVILSTFVFTRLRDINRNFLSLLQKSMDMSLPLKLFADYTVLYGRITTTIEKVEKALSLVSFFLYGYMLSCVFAVTSYMVTRNPDSFQVSGVLFQVVIFVEVVGCFIFLSIRAAGVNESAVEVKNLVHSLPSMRRLDLDANLLATLLQLANNFAGEVCVTGWGLFTINRGFILTTAGVVVTYGVILFQLGSA